MAAASPDVVSVPLYLAQRRGDSRRKPGSLGHRGRRVGVTIAVVVVVGVVVVGSLVGATSAGGDQCNAHGKADAREQGRAKVDGDRRLVVVKIQDELTRVSSQLN